VHRASAGVKLVTLVLGAVAAVVLPGLPAALALLTAAVAVHLLARLAWRRTLRDLVVVLVTSAVLGAYQWWARGPVRAAEVVADLVALVLLATVVTSTTRSDALLDVVARVVRPLRRVGVRPESVTFAIALLLRSVPVLLGLAVQAREAARARGLERDPRAVVVPAAVRMVGHARATAEALAARGLGDEAP